jgi:regulatory protein
MDGGPGDGDRAGRRPGDGRAGGHRSAGGRRNRTYGERSAAKAAIDDPQVVLDAAARFLEARSRSVDEVRRRLTGAGFRAELVEGAIARLTELGVLDDEAFARAWLASRDRARPRGERAIRQELGRKGVDRSSVDLVLSERRDALVNDDPDGRSGASPDRLAAERLIARHGRSLARVSDPRQRQQRAYQLLARHGFDSDVCHEVAAMVPMDDLSREIGEE